MSASHKVFTADEKQTIIDLVSRYPYIEDKKTDVMSLAKKKKAWESIAAAFNSKEEVTKRTLDQLKKCWVNMKTRRKKELAEEASSRMRTGGGPPEPDAGSFPEMDAVAPHLSHHAGFYFDSDVIVTEGVMEGTSSNEQPEEVEEHREVGSLETEVIAAVAQETTGNWKSVTPKPVSRQMALETELEYRKQRASVQKEQDGKIFLLRLEEQRYLVEVAKEKLRILKEEEKRTESAFKEEEMRKKASFEAEERRKEEIHALRLSQMES